MESNSYQWLQEDHGDSKKFHYLVERELRSCIDSMIASTWLRVA